MRLVTYEQRDGRGSRVGVLSGDTVRDISALLKSGKDRTPHINNVTRALGAEFSMVDLLKASQGALEGLADAINGALGPVPEPLERIVQQAPLLEPPSIRDFYAFESHVKRARERRGLAMVPEWYEIPAFYFSNPSAVYGPGEEIPFPSPWLWLDYELEIACVIGRGGRDIPEEEAEAHIAGYMIMNDWSARDIQQKEMRIGLGPAKGKDFATSFGPWLATPDEIAAYRTERDRFDLHMTARVNGNLYSEGNFKDIHWTFPQMIAWASKNALLRPGDVLGSGTVGSGCILELGPEQYGWLKPGDVVELEVTGLGKLTNQIGPASRKG